MRIQALRSLGCGPGEDAHGRTGEVGREGGPPAHTDPEQQGEPARIGEPGGQVPLVAVAQSAVGQSPYGTVDARREGSSADRQRPGEVVWVTVARQQAYIMHQAAIIAERGQDASRRVARLGRRHDEDLAVELVIADLLHRHADFGNTLSCQLASEGVPREAAQKDDVAGEIVRLWLHRGKSVLYIR